MGWLWRTNEGVSSVLGQDTWASLFQPCLSAVCAAEHFTDDPRDDVYAQVCQSNKLSLHHDTWWDSMNTTKAGWPWDSCLWVLVMCERGQQSLTFGLYHQWQKGIIGFFWSDDSAVLFCLGFFGSVLSQLWWKVHTQVAMLWHALASEEQVYYTLPGCSLMTYICCCLMPSFVAHSKTYLNLM